MNIEYKLVDKYVSENKNKKALEYSSCSQEWDKEEGSSKSKSRIRNIIVFNEDKKEEIDLEFTFDNYLKNEK